VSFTSHTTISKVRCAKVSFGHVLTGASCHGNQLSTWENANLPLIAYPTVGDATQRARVETFSKAISEAIAQRKKRLVSGFGLTVGSATLGGALGVVLQEAAPNLERSFLLRYGPYRDDHPDVQRRR